MPLFLPPLIPPGTFGSRPQPIVAGDGVLLRPWTVADAPALVTAYAGPDIQRWHVRSMDADEVAGFVLTAAESWRSETAANWAIAHPDTDEIIGRVGLRWVDLKEGSGEVVYWVLPTHRGRGVASAALEALTRWAFADLGLHRLELMHSVANAASCAVATRGGYEPEGTKRRHGRHLDGWHDMHLHARLNPAG